MKTIFLTNPYEGKMRDLVYGFLPEGFHLILPEGDSQEECMEKIRDADYLFAGHSVRIDAPLLDAGKNIKMITRFGVGTDTIDQKALKERGIPLYMNRGVNARSVAELTVLLMLAMLRELPRMDAEVHAHKWNVEGMGRRELCGQTVGLIGFGHIGSLVAELLRPFGVKILFWQPEAVTDETKARYNVSYRELDDLLKESDIVSLHCMMNENNRGMMNRELFSKMKDGARFINTSRGALINEKDFAEAILSGKLSSAALDVFETEPLPDDSPLRNLPNVILSPHIGGVTFESFQRIMSQSFRNIQKFDAGDLDAIADRRFL